MANEGVKFTFDEKTGSNTRIRVFGVGGAGCNAVNRMIEAGIKGVTFIAVNTDEQALQASNADIKLQIGVRLTRGRGAGADPEVGRAAALEETERLIELLEDTDMVFVTSGFGGGDRYRGRSDCRFAGERIGCSDRRCGHEAVRLRGQAAYGHCR